MYYVYLTCFLIGGTLMVGQFLLSLLGLGHHDADHDFHGGDHDLHTDHDAHGEEHGEHHTGHDSYVTWFASMLTFRTAVAAVTFFGLLGLTAASRWSPEEPRTIAVAVAGGLLAFLLVGYLMRSLHRLRADGTVRMKGAVGKNGTVYLTIPGQKAGAGKVTLTLQNRIVEYQAITANHELPTGAKVVVVGVVNSSTVEVVPAPASGV